MVVVGLVVVGVGAVVGVVVGDPPRGLLVVAVVVVELV